MLKLNAFKSCITGVPIHWADSHGWCALHVAVLQNNTTMVDYLINTRTNLNYRNRNGWAPIHIAVKKGLIEMTKKLVRVRGLFSEINRNLAQNFYCACFFCHKGAKKLREGKKIVIYLKNFIVHAIFCHYLS